MWFEISSLWVDGVSFILIHSEKESKDHLISPHGLEFYLIFGVDWFDLFRVPNVCRDCVYTS